MINGNYVSIGEVLWKVMNNPLCTDLSYDQMAEYAKEYLRILGAPLSFEQKSQRLEVYEHKAYLPKNIIQVQGVRYFRQGFENAGVAMRYATDIYPLNDRNYSNGGIDIFNTVVDKPISLFTPLPIGYYREDHTDYTYKIQNCVIQTSIREGNIEVSYKSIVTDEFGYPMIPDNMSFIVGLEYYCIFKHLENVWAVGKVPDKVFAHYSQQKDWYTGQAMGSMAFANTDHIQATMNSVNRLIRDTDPQRSFYKNMGQKEVIKQHH